MKSPMCASLRTLRAPWFRSAAGANPLAQMSVGESSPVARTVGNGDNSAAQDTAHMHDRNASTVGVGARRKRSFRSEDVHEEDLDIAAASTSQPCDADVNGHHKPRSILSRLELSPPKRSRGRDGAHSRGAVVVHGVRDGVFGETGLQRHDARDVRGVRGVARVFCARERARPQHTRTGGRTRGASRIVDRTPA